jgi:hypothetical protein
MFEPARQKALLTPQQLRPSRLNPFFCLAIR